MNYPSYSYSRNNPETLIDPTGSCGVAPGTNNWFGRRALIDVIYFSVGFALCCWPGFMAGPEAALGALMVTIGVAATVASYLGIDWYWVLAFIVFVISNVIRAIAPSWGWFSWILYRVADFIGAIAFILGANNAWAQAVAGSAGRISAGVIFVDLYYAIDLGVNGALDNAGIGCDYQTPLPPPPAVSYDSATSGPVWVATAGRVGIM